MLEGEPRSLPFPPGTMLAGKYRVERLLGEGGMGWVVVATHVHLEQRVALKFMRASHAAQGTDAVARFIREARAAARIQSEHVARVSDVGTLENGAPYLVMEYLEGHDLDAELRRNRPMPLTLAVDYALQACEGLAEAHAAGIVHRDLKPANLFLARRSDGSVRVKLLDFGISKLAPVDGGRASEGGMTSTQALMGSPLYMSPEQLRSSKNVDRRTDIWSMGIILYEMLGGAAPYQADTLPEVCARIMAESPPPLRSMRPEVPPALEAVVLRCLDKDPIRRFQDAGALAQALASFGGPDARAAAERIGRVVRASTPGLQEARADASGGAAPMTAQAASGIVQTSASFGTVGPARTARRSAAVPLAIGGAVVAAVVIVAVASTRGKRETPSSGNPGASAAMADTSSPSAMAATTASTATPPPPSAFPPPSAPAAVVSVSLLASAALAPSAPAAARTTPPSTHATSRPKASAAGATSASAKPAGTSGFGGRD